MRLPGGYESHEAADVFPMLEGPEFAALVEDVRTNGLLSPIVTWRGQVLDGRNRLRACFEAAVDPRFDDAGDVDPVAFVVSQNLHRRHLTESQRAMVASRLATRRQGQRGVADTSLTQAAAAALLNVSERTIRDARKVSAAAPEVAEAVERGLVSIDAAILLTRIPSEARRDVLRAARVNEGRKPSPGVIRSLVKQAELVQDGEAPALARARSELQALASHASRIARQADSRLAVAALPPEERAIDEELRRRCDAIARAARDAEDACDTASEGAR